MQGHGRLDGIVYLGCSDRGMTRFILAVCLALLAAPAAAECIDETAAWSTPYSQGTIQIVTYYVWQQAPPAPPATKPPLLAVIFRSGEYHLHVNVPTSVAQRFTSVSNADTTYNSFVKSRFSQTLLAESRGGPPCPLRSENDVYLLGQRP